MRKGTKSFISILSLGLVAAGYQAGQAAQISAGFSAAASPIMAGATLPTATTAPVASSIPITSSAPSTTQAATPKATNTAIAPASTPKATTSAPAPVSTPQASTTAAAPAPAAASTTKNGSAISYRYGTVQVSVTKANGKISAVNLLQAGASGGRQGAFSYLVDYAIQANGSSFGNLGGATYTTQAFKQSLESALAKF